MMDRAILAVVLAQTSVTQPAGNAAATASNAVSAMGIPVWVWAIVAVVILAAIVFALARRKRKVAVIKTRLG